MYVDNLLALTTKSEHLYFIPHDPTIKCKTKYTTLSEQYIVPELQIKKIPVRHWVLQVREFC
jgi:hypothetical protein